VTWRSQVQALTAVFVLSISAAAQPQNSVFAKGVELFQQARFEEALQAFEQASHSQPGNAAIQNAIGLADTKLKRIDEANRHYENAIQLNPKAADAHRNLGVNHLDARRYDAAEKQLRSALAIEPDSAFSHYYLALVFLATNRDKDAAAEAEPARALLANDPDAEFHVAEACLRSGSTEQGLAFVDALENRSLLNATQEFDLATLMNSKRLYAQTVARLRRVAQMNPTAWVNRYNLADALLEAGKTEESISLLEALSAEQPRKAPVQSLLGLAYQTAGKLDRALETYRNAVAFDPGNQDYYLDYARTLADLNRYDESEQFIESSLRQFGDDYALTVRLGALQMMQGKLEAARDTFRKAISSNPNLALGHVALAQTYLRERRDEDAVRELAETKTRLGSDANVDHYLGLALVRLQRYQEAIGPLEQAIRLNPNNPETYFQLGKANEGLDRMKAACEAFEHAIRLDPQNAGAHYQLSRIYAQLGNTIKAQQMAGRTRQLIQSQREEGLKAQRARLGVLEPIK
jgi:tetratricopeptide (TPR) repeat protein